MREARRREAPGSRVHSAEVTCVLMQEYSRPMRDIPFAMKMLREKIS